MTVSNTFCRRSLSTVRQGSKRSTAKPVNLPFQTHLSSATSRHRDERSTAIENTGTGASADTGGTSTSTSMIINDVTNHQQNGKRNEKDVGDSSGWRISRESIIGGNTSIDGDIVKNNNRIKAFGGRLVRRNIDEQNNQHGGSFAATMSATAKHRQMRQNMSMNETKLKNPSILSIPVSNDNANGMTLKDNGLEAKEHDLIGDVKESNNGNGTMSLVIGGSMVGTGIAIYSGFIPIL